MEMETYLSQASTRKQGFTKYMAKVRASLRRSYRSPGTIGILTSQATMAQQSS